MSYDIFHSYGFDKVRDNESLNESFSDKGWERVASKSVPDSDGFMTEYTWYTNGYKHIFMFGDSDIYSPDIDYADWECETEAEAQEWFDSYTGFDECDDEDEWLDECTVSKEEFFDKGFKEAFGIEVEDDNDDTACTNPLTEAYNNLPTWFTNFLDNHADGKAVKNVLNNRGIDLANATYIQGEMPRSNRDPVLKDPHRLAIFRLEDGHGPKVYILGVNNPYLHVPSPGRSWDFKYAKELPMKTILELATEYGYIDTNDSRNSNRAVRGERAALRRAAGPQRGKGQYPVERTTYETDEYGRRDYDKPTGTSIEWVMSKGQDKSGYPLDPEKYKRMLDNVGLDTYGARLEAYYKKIEAIRSRIIACMNRFSIDDSSKFRSSGMFSRNMFGDIADTTSSLARAIEYYQRLKEDCAKCIKRWEGKATTEELDERIKEIFQWNAKTVRDYIEDAAKSIEKIENAKELVPEE